MSDIIARSFDGWVLLAEHRGTFESLWIQYDSNAISQTGSKQCNPPNKTMNAFSILIILALILSIIDLIKPTAPLMPVAGILICAALLAGSAGWIQIAPK